MIKITLVYVIYNVFVIPYMPLNVILSKMLDFALRADLKETTFGLLFKYVGKLFQRIDARILHASPPFTIHSLYDPQPQVSLVLFFLSPSDRNWTSRTLDVSLVRLNLEYFSVMWSPYTIRNINKLETFCILARLTGIRPCVLSNKWLPNK